MFRFSRFSDWFVCCVLCESFRTMLSLRWLLRRWANLWAPLSMCLSLWWLFGSCSLFLAWIYTWAISSTVQLTSTSMKIRCLAIRRAALGSALTLISTAFLKQWWLYLSFHRSRDGQTLCTKLLTLQAETKDQSLRITYISASSSSSSFSSVHSSSWTSLLVYFSLSTPLLRKRRRKVIRLPSWIG